MRRPFPSTSTMPRDSKYAFRGKRPVHGRPGGVRDRSSPTPPPSPTTGSSWAPANPLSLQHNKKREEMHRLQEKYPEQAARLERKVGCSMAPGAGEAPAAAGVSLRAGTKTQAPPPPHPCS